MFSGHDITYGVCSVMVVVTYDLQKWQISPLNNIDKKIHTQSFYFTGVWHNRLATVSAVLLKQQTKKNSAYKNWWKDPPESTEEKSMPLHAHVLSVGGKK